ncbi:MAG TPA: hypothetical protein VGM88_16180 [Kofleriaceae bacterium]
MKAAIAALAIAAAGCHLDRPLGFSPGDTWTLPLVGPLENDVLVTPVWIGGHGPYLFAIDPDAPKTIVDDRVVADAKLVEPTTGPWASSEEYETQMLHHTTVHELRAGTLGVAWVDVVVVKAGTYDSPVREIDGVLGADVIASQLVFSFDRDAGLATLSTAHVFHPPAGASHVSWIDLTEDDDNPVDIVPARRHTVLAKLGGQRMSLHIDLGAKDSQLRDELWTGLPQHAVNVRTTDETGASRTATVAATEPVALGDLHVRSATFLPYEEQRWSQDLAGTLALDFFREDRVWMAYRMATLYVAARVPVAPQQRIARWTALRSCAHPGCVTVELQVRNAEPALIVTRDADAPDGPLEIRLEAPAAEARSVPALLVELPKGVARVESALRMNYDGAHLEVADASPFAKPCLGGCVIVAP